MCRIRSKTQHGEAAELERHYRVATQLSSKCCLQVFSCVDCRVYVQSLKQTNEVVEAVEPERQHAEMAAYGSSKLCCCLTHNAVPNAHVPGLLQTTRTVKQLSWRGSMR